MRKFKRGLLITVLCMALVSLFALSGCGQSSDSASSESSSSDSTESAEAQLDPDVDYTKPFFCLIMGGDTRVGTADEKKVPDTESRSDVMILAYVNPQKKYISLMSIPRDTDVTYKGEEMKINNIMYKDGPEATCKFLGKKLGIDIPYYFEMSFVQWADFVDNMDGVTVDVPVSLEWRDIIKGDTVSIEAGDDQTLNGTEALVLARDRHQYEGPGEAVRQINNRNMVKSLITKVSKSDNPTQYVDILLSGCDSNMNSAELTEYMNNFLSKDGKISWNLGSAPWEGSFITSDYWAVPSDWETMKSEVKAMKKNTPLTDIVALPVVSAGSN
ncbi:MAG: LCP family protein [Eggerthellaceae bacterium]